MGISAIAVGVEAGGKLADPAEMLVAVAVDTVESLPNGVAVDVAVGIGKSDTGVLVAVAWVAGIEVGVGLAGESGAGVAVSVTGRLLTSVAETATVAVTRVVTVCVIPGVVPGVSSGFGVSSVEGVSVAPATGSGLIPVSVN